MAAVEPSTWRIRLFGGLSACRGSEVVDQFSTRRAALLLAYLAEHLGRRVPRERVATALWPDSPPDKARASLSVALTSLRRQLETEASRGAVIQGRRFDIALNPATVTVDAVDFDAFVSAADHATTPAERIAALEQALDLYTGEFLPGYYDDWVIDRQRRYAEEMRRVVQGLVDHCLPREPALALSYLGRGLALDPDQTDWAEQAARLARTPPRPARANVDPGAVDGQGATVTYLVLSPAAALAAVVAAAPAAERVPELRDAVQLSYSAAPAAAERALRAVAGSDRPALAVLHTGWSAGEPRPEALRHAIQIAGLARAPQVICTGEAAALLERGLPREQRLTPLGRYRLGRNHRPERLFRLSAPQLPPPPSPPLRIAAAASAGLPLPANRFFGREKERAAVLARLQDPTCRLITLLGPGGVGKTRLALEAARSAGTEFGGLAFFVACDQERDACRLADRLRWALHLPPSGAADVEQQIADALAEEPALVVFDNLEHVLDAARPGIERLLRAVPTLTVLATSREPLGLPAETIVRLRPLPVPADETAGEPASSPAVALFLDRARQAQPDFALTEVQRPAVLELCRKLEGLPLAIEITASQCRRWPPRRLLREFDAWLDLSRPSYRGSPRHRTLRAAIDWSYHLLPPETQRFLAAVSVFHDGFDAAAAAAVADDPAVAERIAALQFGSLLTATDAGAHYRYTMLESVRHYAAERLASEDRQAETVARHADWYRGWSRRLTESAELSEAERLDRLAAERANLDAALRWLAERRPAEAVSLALDLLPLWRVRGRWSDGLAWLERLLATGAGTADERAQASTGAAELTFLEREAPAARELAEQAVALATRPGTLARALGVLIDIAQHQNDRERTISAIERLQQLAETSGDRHLLATARWRRGAAATLMNHPVDLVGYSSSESISELRSAVDLAHPGDDLRLLAFALSDYGIACQLVNRFDDAFDALHEALELARALGDRWLEGRTLWALADGQQDRGNVAAAWPLAQEALRLLTEVGNEWGLAYIFLCLASAANAAGRPDLFCRLLGCAEAVNARIGTELAAATRGERRDEMAVAVRALGEEEAQRLRQAGFDLPAAAAVQWALSLPTPAS